MTSRPGTDHDSSHAVANINDVTGNLHTDDKMATPTPSDEAIRTRSYHHDPHVSEDIEMTKRLGLDGPTCQSTTEDINNEVAQTDDEHKTTLSDIDMPACVRDGKTLASDTEPFDLQQNDGSGIASRVISGEETATETANSTHSTNSSTEITPEPGAATLASTQPMPTIYPPRRPNIFSKRAPRRNVGWSSDVLATITASTVEDTEDDADGLTMEEIKAFQAEEQEKMARKTAGFLRMASQYSWRPRVVEDLGEAFEIEE